MMFTAVPASVACWPVEFVVLTFLPEESCGSERDGRAATDETVAVKVEPTWDDEDWDEEGNWPDSGEEDWYENGPWMTSFLRMGRPGRTKAARATRIRGLPMGRLGVAQGCSACCSCGCFLQAAKDWPAECEEGHGQICDAEDLQ